jgi:hypothetical protein
MRKKSVKKYILMLIMLIASSELLASAESDYESGVEAYTSGDNAAAISFFESAQAQGMETIALKYNLASSYYRAGQLVDARVLFEQLAWIEGMQDLSNYHLGQIAMDQRDRATATYHFDKVVTSGKDEKLSKLSQKYLALLAKDEPRWQSYINLNLGYDDNINSVTGDSVLDEADNFAELAASTEYLLSGQRRDGWMLNAILHAIEYQDNDSTDQVILSAGIKRSLRLADWDTSANLLLSKSTYGGDDFQTTTKLDVVGRKPLTRRHRLYLRYRAEDIRSDNALYDYLEGWRQRGRVEYRHYDTNNIKYLYYELELNDRGQLVTPVDSYEYSPTRHTIRGIYTHVLGNKWWLTGDVAYRASDFDPSPTIDRIDDQWTFGLSAEYLIDKTFRLTTKYQLVDNSSSVDRYNYDKSIFKVGLSKLF